MTIEEEIRRRLRAMGMDEESVEPCLQYVKAEPNLRWVRNSWRRQSAPYRHAAIESLWEAAKSSALDYLEQKYHVEPKKEN